MLRAFQAPGDGAGALHGGRGPAMRLMMDDDLGIFPTGLALEPG